MFSKYCQLLEQQHETSFFLWNEYCNGYKNNKKNRKKLCFWLQKVANFWHKFTIYDVHMYMYWVSQNYLHTSLNRCRPRPLCGNLMICSYRAGQTPKVFNHISLKNRWTIAYRRFSQGMGIMFIKETWKILIAPSIVLRPPSSS